MKLATIAAAFQTIGGETRRGPIVRQVAELLEEASPSEVAPLVYLMQGQLAAPFEGVQLGAGEAMLVTVLADTWDETEAAVTRRYKKLGDLGLVAESLAKGKGRGVTLLDAFRALHAVARTSGSGSQGRKAAMLSRLLARLTGPEAKLIVRVAQGRLRLGVGDQTILEAAAVAAWKDRKAKPIIEHAYNVRSDLGGVVALAFSKGRRALEGIGPKVGTPVRPALAQRLASAEAIIHRLGEAQVEPKYDGFRLQLHRDGRQVWAFSRRLEDVTGMFPDLAQAMRRQFRNRQVIIDGEALVYNPDTGEFLPFQVTMSRKRKTRIAEMAAQYPLRLFAFDLLQLGSRNCLPLSQRERTRRLHAAAHSDPDTAIAVTDHIMTRKPAELQAYFDEMISRGLEGVVCKRPSAPYQAGARGYDWIKLKRAYQSKLRDTVDLVLLGYLRGRGKRAALGVGSLLAGVYDDVHDRYRTIAKIGSGLSEAEWKALRRRLDQQTVRRKPRNVDSLITPDVWVSPSGVVEVLADEITRSPSHTCGRKGDEPGYALRFPRMLKIRTDKGPEDATTEGEILDLFRIQRGGGRKKRRR
jgi:DNA ligase 1